MDLYLNLVLSSNLQVSLWKYQKQLIPLNGNIFSIHSEDIDFSSSKIDVEIIFDVIHLELHSN